MDEEFHDREMEWILNSAHKPSFLLLTEEGAAVGLLELSLRNVVDGCVGGPVGFLEGLYLDPAWRGQGWGRRLLAHAEGWLRVQGCRQIATDAELENEATQEFYRSLGFQETWRIVQFKKPLDV